jgi:DNA-binding protein YbaB
MSVSEKIKKQIDGLPENLQKKVLQYAKSLKNEHLKGISGKAFVKLSGAFSLEDLEIMKKEIALGCGHIDPNDW